MAADKKSARGANVGRGAGPDVGARAVAVPPAGPPPLPSTGGSPTETPTTEPRVARSQPQSETAAQGASRTALADSTDQATAQPSDRAEDDGETGRRKAQRRPAGPSRGRIAANDDAPSIGGLIYALNQKPSNKPFVIAAVISGLWAALGVGVGSVVIAPEIMSGKGIWAVVTTAGIMPAIATLCGPIALFWFMAMLAWRADELKLRSTAMTEVAVRLAEPDRMAEQSVASLGQSVRRQVSFMNDAVSRALGRAGELEALVHNEVTALERSYEDNERKIRGLIQELAGERHALSSTGDQMSETLRNLGNQVPALIDTLSNQQLKLARIIEGAGQNLTALETAIGTQTGTLETTLGKRTDHLQSVLETYTAAVGNALGSRTTEIQGVLETYTNALGTALGNRTQEMEQMFGGYMASLDTTMGGRTETLQTVFEEYARALDTTLANRAQALDSQLIERTKTLDDAFSERLRLFDESILRSTLAIDGAVGEKANALSAAMEYHARNMSETIGKQAVELDETLMHGINAVRRTSENITKQSIKAIEGLANQSDLLKSVSENLLGQINNVTNRFENQGQSIMKAANALETANYKIDVTLQNRQQELGHTLDRMSNKADDLGRFMQGYSSTLEGSLTEAESRTRLLTDEMARGAEQRSRSTLADIERLKRDAATETDRALTDLRSQFSNVSQEVTQRLGSLTEQFTTTSSQMRDRTTTAANELAAEQERMRAQLNAMPTAARENTDAMRRALGDQLRALEQLSTLTNREAGRRDVAPPVAGAGAGGPVAAQYPAPPREDRGRALSTLGSSLAQEIGARQARPQAAPQATAPAQGAAAAPAAGWSLGDLLARASNGEESAGDRGGAMQAPQPSQRAGGMQPQGIPTQGVLVPVARTGHGVGLNVDVISRALDPATASAIWSRFRTGQRGIMVRSIYTTEGRIAFDEVSRRYQSEPDFQQTVNRYLADYERILGESDRRDPSGRLSQNQLTSDTGRVYLFLAHVSGRLT